MMGRILILERPHDLGIDGYDLAWRTHPISIQRSTQSYLAYEPCARVLSPLARSLRTLLEILS